RELARRDRSAHRPTVELYSPTADGFEGQPRAPQILWHGADEDGGPLYCLVQYSSGPHPWGEGDWQTLATDWTDERLVVNLDELPGGPEAGVRIYVSDGFNTALAWSPRLAVADKAPDVRIIAPAELATLQERERIVLRGSAWDPEQGALPPERLQWSSSRDGVLGTGHRLEVPSLSAGVHELTLLVTDDAGHGASDAITVHVNPHINSQPVAHAGTDRAGFVGVELMLDGGASYDLDGDALAFSWTLASKPQGSLARLADADGAHPRLLPDLTGAYEIALTVHDRQLASRADRVRLTVSEPLPPLCLPLVLQGGR
ncbi:MAG: hypothetical protein V1772_10675, partial [Chloroflexota bacterium]